MNFPDDYPRIGEQIDVWIESIIRGADGQQVKLTQHPPGGAA